MTSAIQLINNVDTKESKTKTKISKTSELLSESSAKIARTCHLLEVVEKQKKSQMKSEEQLRHKINSLELELRKQGDIANMLQQENEALSNELLGVNELKNVIFGLEKEIKENELKSAERREELIKRNNELEEMYKKEQIRAENLAERLNGVKEDNEMLTQLKDKYLEDLEGKNADDANLNSLSEEIKALKANVDKKASQIEVLKQLKLSLEIKIQELESQIGREELHTHELNEEIAALKEKNLQLEEKFHKEKIEGNAHIGLSKIDFLGHSNFGFGREMSMRPSKLPAMIKENGPGIIEESMLEYTDELASGKLLEQSRLVGATSGGKDYLAVPAGGAGGGGDVRKESERMKLSQLPLDRPYQVRSSLKYSCINRK